MEIDNLEEVYLSELELKLAKSQIKQTQIRNILLSILDKLNESLYQISKPNGIKEANDNINVSKADLNRCLKLLGD